MADINSEAREKMCVGCGSMYKTHDLMDLELWGNCPMCESGTLSEYLDSINQNHQ